MNRTRHLVQLLVCLTPSGVKEPLLRRLLGWEIHRTAVIGWSLFTGVEFVRLGPGARIGHGNVFRNLRLLDLRADASIGQWNWITTAEYFRFGAEVPATEGSFVMDENSVVLSRHYLDCSAGITLGKYAAIVGMRSTLITHNIDTSAFEFECRPITIGDYSLVSSCVSIGPGARIPERCLIGMGAVIVGELDDAGTFYAGVPARPRGQVGTGEWFHRTIKTL